MITGGPSALVPSSFTLSIALYDNPAGLPVMTRADIVVPSSPAGFKSILFNASYPIIAGQNYGVSFYQPAPFFFANFISSTTSPNCQITQGIFRYFFGGAFPRVSVPTGTADSTGPWGIEPIVRQVDLSGTE